MKKHLVITWIGYTAAGYGAGIEQFGAKAGISLTVGLTVFISCMVLWAVAVFVSVPKIEEALREKDQRKNEPEK